VDRRESVSLSHGGDPLFFWKGTQPRPMPEDRRKHVPAIPVPEKEKKVPGFPMGTGSWRAPYPSVRKKKEGRDRKANSRSSVPSPASVTERDVAPAWLQQGTPAVRKGARAAVTGSSHIRREHPAVVGGQGRASPSQATTSSRSRTRKGKNSPVPQTNTCSTPASRPWRHRGV